MEVTVQALEGLKREIKVVVPSEEIDPKVEQRLKEIQPTISMRGFRKGKVPANIVKQQYGKQIREEVVYKELEQSCAKAISQEKLNPAGRPNIQILSDEAGKPLEYLAQFEVYPHIELEPLEGVELQEWDATVSEQDVKDLLEKLRRQQAEWVLVDRSAQKGDKVVIDYEGLIDDKPFEGGTGSKIRVELGGEILISDLEEGIIGLKSGETKDIPATFPVNYPNKNFAGVSAVFRVVLHEVLEPQLPELNDAFAEKLGIKEGGLEKLKENLRETMEQELTKTTKNLIKQQLLDKFLEINAIEVPQSIVENEIGRLIHETEHELNLKKRGKDLANFPREHFQELAEIRVRLGLLFSEFIKANKIKVDPDRVRNFVEQLAAAYQKPEQIIDWYYNNKQQLAQIEARVMEDQVVEKLFEQVKIVKKPGSYQDVMNYKPEEVKE